MAARQVVQHDGGGADPADKSFGTGRLDGLHTMLGGGGQDLDELPVGGVTAAQPSPDLLQVGRQGPIPNRAPLRKAPGLRTSTGT